MKSAGPWIERSTCELGREIDHGRGPVLLQHVCNKLAVANVAVNEMVTRVIHDARKIIKVARISELVETDDRG